MTERRGRIHKQLLDDLKEEEGYWKFKEETLDRILLITRFGRGCGRVVRQTEVRKPIILRLKFQNL